MTDVNDFEVVREKAFNWSQWQVGVASPVTGIRVGESIDRGVVSTLGLRTSCVLATTVAFSRRAE